MRKMRCGSQRIRLSEHRRAEREHDPPFDRGIDLRGKHNCLNWLPPTVIVSCTTVSSLLLPLALSRLCCY